MSGPRPEQDWFEKAEQNLEMGRRAMLPGNPISEMACYHAQQCAEKHLKGFLVSRSHSFNFVHDLFYLTQECAQRQPAFGSWNWRPRLWAGLVPALVLRRLLLPPPRTGRGRPCACPSPASTPSSTAPDR